jgi:hypothetical protein
MQLDQQHHASQQCDGAPRAKAVPHQLAPDAAEEVHA